MEKETPLARLNKLMMEQNKKYMPPSINLICKNFVVSKYLYEMKDTLRIRKKEMDEQALRNTLLEIALPFGKRSGNKDLLQKIVDFNSERISAKKFFELLKAF